MSQNENNMEALTEETKAAEGKKNDKAKKPSKPKKVEIKKKFAAVLDQSDLQDIKTAEFMDSESEKFENQSKALNI